jgi:hypothetical protein
VPLIADRAVVLSERGRVVADDSRRHGPAGSGEPDPRTSAPAWSDQPLASARHRGRGPCSRVGDAPPGAACGRGRDRAVGSDSGHSGRASLVERVSPPVPPRPGNALLGG